MKITVTFDSLEEFQSCMHMTPAIVDWQKPEMKEIEKPAEKNAEKPQEAREESEPVKSTPKEEKPQEEATAKQEEAPKVDRVAVRKLLASLNKKTGTNTASGLIADLGFDKLTNVPDDRLAELQAKAEEAMNNAE